MELMSGWTAASDRLKKWKIQGLTGSGPPARAKETRRATTEWMRRTAAPRDAEKVI